MKTMYIQLEHHEQQAARDLARDRQVILPALFAGLLEEYAARPMPDRMPAPAVPQSELLETRVPVPYAVYLKVRERARAEQKPISDVVYDLVIQARVLQESSSEEPGLAELVRLVNRLA